jgi:hypothetical protein
LVDAFVAERLQIFFEPSRFSCSGTSTEDDELEIILSGKDCRAYGMSTLLRSSRCILRPTRMGLAHRDRRNVCGWIERASERSRIFSKEELFWSHEFDADIAGQISVRCQHYIRCGGKGKMDLSEQEKSALMPFEVAVRPPASPTK